MENIHRCTQMPAHERLLITGKDVFRIDFRNSTFGDLKKVGYGWCPYCGALLKEVAHEDTSQRPASIQNT